MKRLKKNGFTAVEMLVTIIVAVTLLGGGFMLYNTATKASGSARMRFKANNIAYDFMRQYANTASSPCVASTATPSISAQMDQLANASVAVAVTCPMAPAMPNLSLVTVTVTYNESGSQRSVTRAVLR